MANPSSPSPGFARQLTVAAAVMGVLIGGLYLLGQSQADNLSEEDLEASLGAQVAPPGLPAAPAQNALQQDSAAASQGALKPASFSARSLLPANAWLIVELEGKLFGEAPFGDQGGICSSVSAPERVALGVLQPGAGDALQLLLAAPRVSAPFWGCAKERVLSSGGKAVAAESGIEVLRSKSGVLIHSDEGHLLFSTSQDDITLLLGIITGAVPGAGAIGPHKELAANLSSSEANGAAPPSALATLFLPDDWLASVGSDADKTPLRHLRAAALLARPDGSAAGALHCREPGCAELGQFLERAKKDLSTELPGHLRKAVAEGLSARYVAGAPGGLGRLALSFASPAVSVTELLSAFISPESLLGGALPAAKAPPGGKPEPQLDPLNKK